MSSTIKRIKIKNFKSFRDVDINLNKFNIIVGKNGTGKTNFIECFKFLKNLITSQRRPFIPHIDWWSFRNIVWNGNDNIPIEFEIDFDIYGFEIFYKISIIGSGGFVKILFESVEIKDYCKFVREANMVFFETDDNFLEKNSKKIKNLLEVSKYPIIEKNVDFRFQEQEFNIDNLSILSIPYSANTYYDRYIREDFSEDNISLTILNISSQDFYPKLFLIFSPILKADKNGIYPMFLYVLDQLRSIIRGFTIMRHPYMKLVKEPSKPVGEETISEDSSNLNNVFYNIWNKNFGNLPESVESYMSSMFPNTQIRPELSSDGKIFLKIYDYGVELDPPSVSDGLYKSLSILFALESNPKLLAIDEIENCLYAEALEYIFDELRESDSTIILTTHSPLVVDLAKLDELIFFERDVEGTKHFKIKDIEKARRKLIDNGLKQSESWIYGKLY